MLTSLELRWFCPGKLPRPVDQWFQQECPGQILQSPDERVDHYLYIPDCDYMSVKLRQGRLEVKWRQQALGAIAPLAHAQGQSERWLKWMCTNDDGENLTFGEQRLTGPWLAVDKLRSQRKYRIHGHGSFTGVVVDEPLERGCAVELTRLRLQAEDWWTIGFETFGSALLLSDLQGLAQQVLQSYPGPTLELSNSWGYPEWLSRAGIFPKN